MPARWDDAATLRQDAWVLVTGNIESVTIKGQRVPMIVAETVQPVDAPDQPYLFP